MYIYYLIMNKRIYLCLAHMSGKEQMYIKEAFDTNWVVPLGPNVNGFEKDLEEFVGEGKHVVALSAGTAAVHLALLACVRGLGGGYLEYGSWILCCWKRLLKIVSRRREKHRKRLYRWPYWDAL